MNTEQKKPSLNDLSVLMNNVVQFMILLSFDADDIRKIVDAYNHAMEEWGRVNVKEAKIVPIYPYINHYRKEVNNEEEQEEQAGQ